MKTVSIYNDAKDMHLVITRLQDEQIIIKFTGESIPGVIKAFDYTCKGELENDGTGRLWDVEILDKETKVVSISVFHEEQVSMKTTWAEVIAEFRFCVDYHSEDDITLDNDAIIRFIRCEFPLTANDCDSSERQETVARENSLTMILNAQKELVRLQQKQPELLAELEHLKSLAELKMRIYSMKEKIKDITNEIHELEKEQ